jgi:hypothetical protein
MGIRRHDQDDACGSATAGNQTVRVHARCVDQLVIQFLLRLQAIKAGRQP